MDKNVNYTVVGIFIISLVISIVLCILWLSSGFSLAQYKTYKIYMQESVSGLSIDSPVEYNGVSVGSVKSIELNENNPQLVELLVNIKSNTPITQGTVATLTTRGLTGLAFIALKDTSTNLRPLTVEHGHRYAVIKTAPSIFMRLDTIISQLSKNVNNMAKVVQKLLSPENQELINASLANIERITGTLAKNSGQLSTILVNTSHISRQLVPVLNSLETQTLPAAYNALNNINALSRNMSDLSLEIKRNPSILIRGSAQQPLGPGEK